MIEAVPSFFFSSSSLWFGSYIHKRSKHTRFNQAHPNQSEGRFPPRCQVGSAPSILNVAISLLLLFAAIPKSNKKRIRYAHYHARPTPVPNATVPA